MNTDHSRPLWLERLALICLVILAVIKLQYQFTAEPMADEAYYWLWGQHLDFSYFDHPPLQAWLQRLFGPITGGSNFGLRLPALLVTLCLVAVVWWWAREARRHGHSISTVLALAVFFATPNFYIFTTVVFPDYLAILLISVSGMLFFAVLNQVADGGPVRVAALYGAALALGLAALTKYNSMFFGIAIAVAILAHRPYRGILASPHLYAAAAVSVLCLAPVFYWNVGNGWASFQYNLHDRIEGGMPAWRVLDNIWSFAGNSLLGFSLFLHVGIAFLVLRRPRDSWLANWRVIAIAGFAVPSLFWLGSIFVTHPAAYWNIVAYVPLLPLVALWMRKSWLVAAHLIVGVISAVVFNVQLTVIPLAVLIGGTDAEAQGLYGWPQIAAAVKRDEAEFETDFIVTTYYRTGAVLGFETGDTTVEVISDRRSQFDFWFDEAARAGKDALILADDRHPMPDEIGSRFETIEPVDTVAVTRFGYPIRNYQIYVGRNYLPRTQQP